MWDAGHPEYRPLVALLFFIPPAKALSSIEKAGVVWSGKGRSGCVRVIDDGLDYHCDLTYSQTGLGDVIETGDHL